MDTSARNRTKVLAEAVIKLGLEHVAAYLHLTPWELLQYAKGDVPIPTSLWAHVLHPDSGLIYGPSAQHAKENSAIYPLHDTPESTQPGYADSQPENYEEATPNSAKGRSSPA